MDLSFLPDQPKRKEEKIDLSFLPDQPKGFVGKTVSSIPGSAYEYGKALVTPLIHPIETISNLGNVLKGIDIKLRRLQGQKIKPGEETFEPYAEKAGEFIKERYGGWENIEKTISEDPVGFMGDLSTFLMGAGGLVSKIGPISKVGQTISKVGQVAEPISAAMKTASLPAKLIPEATISKMYESAAKFSTTLKPHQRAKLVSTALEYEIDISMRGMDKIKGLVEDFNTMITDKIDAATQAGKNISINDMVRGFTALENEAKLSGRPMGNLRAIEKLKKEFVDENQKFRPGGFTPQEAQILKQKIYKDLDSYYSSIRENPISVKAQKLIAKNAKEAIEQIIPEVKMLNQKEGALIELRDALERATNRITNRDILGIGIPIKVGAGGIPGGIRGAVLGLTLGLVDTPTVKSKLALVLNRLKERGIKVRPTSTAIRLGLFHAGREGVEPED